MSTTEAVPTVSEQTVEDFIGVSDITSRQENIQLQRKRAPDPQVKSVEKRRKIVISDARICDNVTKPIPAVDRGRADPLNIIRVITDISDNDNTPLLLMEVC